MVMKVPIPIQIEGFCDLLLHLSPVDGHVTEVGSNLCTINRSDFEVRRLHSSLTFDLNFQKKEKSGQFLMVSSKRSE